MRLCVLLRLMLGLGLEALAGGSRPDVGGTVMIDNEAEGALRPYGHQPVTSSLLWDPSVCNTKLLHFSRLLRKNFIFDSLKNSRYISVRMELSIKILEYLTISWWCYVVKRFC